MVNESYGHIPVLDLKQQYNQIADLLEKSVLEVLRSGNYILGKKVAQLEAAIADLCGCRYGIGVGNGTDALILALWALDIGPHDEVITPSFTFAATAEAIALRGAKAVFVDIDPETFNLDVRKVEQAINPATKAILPVHLYGQPANMEPLLQLAKLHNLKIIEDNAQAIQAQYHGKPTGSFGDVSCISFYPTKNLGAAGDAGMIVTNNEHLSERLQVLRAHGMKKRYYHDRIGVNSRLDEIQAAVLLSKLPFLAQWNSTRRRIAQWYEQGLQNLPYLQTPSVAANVTPVWHQYTVRIKPIDGLLENARDRVQHELAQRHIDSMIYYPIPLHRQSAFVESGKQIELPATECAANEVLSLPMYPELSQSQVEHITLALREIMGSLMPTALTQATAVSAVH